MRARLVLDWDEPPAPLLWEVVGERVLGVEVGDLGLPRHLLDRLYQWRGEEREGARLATELSISLGRPVTLGL